ncbi:uncharacterized protein isoform X1 [Choristoneura fumiferana]|uniref:uncharacterized protein isoform X1 n=1 Tax=Choristoneura fumiferana TaxID=7141 RepID=UPI003D15A5D2
MKFPIASTSSMFVVVCTLTLLIISAHAAPMEQDDEQSENSLVAHDGNEMDMSSTPWDAINTAALRKLLLQLDAEERLGLGRVDAPGRKRSPAGGTSEPSTAAWRDRGAPTSAKSASGSATLTLSRASASEHPAPRTTNDSLLRP